MILNDKQDCVESIAKVLERTSAWRKAIAVNFPDDPRKCACCRDARKSSLLMQPTLQRLCFWNVAKRLESSRSLGWLPSQGEGFQFLCQSPCPTAVAYRVKKQKFYNVIL